MKKRSEKKLFLFVYPDFEYNLTKDGIKADPGGWYHEGISQLAAIIEEEGWKTAMVHLTEPISEDEFKKEIEKYDPAIIGFSVRTGVREYAQKLIKWAKDPKHLIIVGSYHATLWPHEVIKWDGVDALCVGEGENPVKQLIQSIDKGRSIDKIGSLWVKDTTGKIHANPVQNMEVDLDSLPLPKFDIFDFKKLIPSQIKAAVIVLTRGCPYNCTYCWNALHRKIYPNKEHFLRHRSPKNCIAYIKKVKEQYPEVMSFRFQDDLWPFHNDWFPNFSKLYIEEIHLPFECHLRANFMNEKTVKTLKEMRCFGAYFGVESGNEYIRNKILKRGMTEEQLLTAFSLCKKYAIKTHAYNIVGLPYENMNRVLDTVKLNARLQPTDMFFPVWFPYRDSELYNIAVESGYYNPEQPLDPDVNLEMPDFKRNRIRFASLYSKTFVRLYQFVFKFPGVFQRMYESLLDMLWLFPYWPFSVMNKYILIKRKLEVKLKVFIKKHFFGLYLFLKHRKTFETNN